ncbi:PREDICTED: probable pectinesterase/pectinesterase inhibitor 13 [Tarenaya hassleriana]|uniref:probable pectinesterase/pectinesterase inhibitor 13 n=1 Tax=Tarenaya hassleriana TaxID=28532 RepID=UPI00053C879F|nr:PREDICTED: probable pectinesterase/pectinesterase inhibitor 13 [Tarenaya hassleriana]
MAFQDFDKIQERVNAERKRKFRKRVIAGSVSFLVVVAAIIGGAFAYVSYQKGNNISNNGNTESKNTNQKSPVSATQSIKHVTFDKIVETLCNSTLYKQNCEKTLKDKAKNDTSLSNPKALVKSAIEAVNVDLDRVLEKFPSLKIENEDDKHAIEQCKLLVEDAKEELAESASKMNDTNVGNFERIVPDLNNWLSAVMTYQETCLDGFEDGELKSDIQKSFNSSQILTSNSLAMIKSLEAYLSSGSKAPIRRLLESKSSDRIPSWVSHEERRMLRVVDVNLLKPNATVAKDGSGNFTTINDALNAMPEKYEGRYIIYIKQGVYDETVTIDKKKANLTMVGDGSQKTIVTGNKSNAKKIRTFLTATFVAQGEGFMAQSMGFRNTAGPEEHQAVAIRIQSDRSIFLNCRFEGYQDTLYAYTHRQYYRSCVIIGTVDFIFGDAAAVFQNCNIFIRKGLKGQKNTVTAQGRIDKFQMTGFVIQNCTITANDDLKLEKGEFQSFLGRPWKKYSRTVVMESTIDDVIDPIGWLRWQETDFAIDTLFYAEFKNDGVSGETSSRVKWPGFKVMSKEEALNYTVGPFLQGSWINSMSCPVKFGLYEL